MLEKTKKQHEAGKIELEQKIVELMKQVEELQKSTENTQLTGTEYIIMPIISSQSSK